MEKPYVICHMMSSLDGKTDSKALRALGSDDEYEVTGDRLKGDAWLCGRVTMQADFAKYAEAAPFRNDGANSTNAPAVHRARKAASYAIAADTLGQIVWKEDDLDGDHIIALVSEKVSKKYLDELKKRKVSYIASGKERIDFAAAFKILAETFGVERLLLEGGGRLNAAVADAGLVDELSLLLFPGVDGRKEPHATFDGRQGTAQDAMRATLSSVEKLANGVLWLRDKFDR